MSPSVMIASSTMLMGNLSCQLRLRRSSLKVFGCRMTLFPASWHTLIVKSKMAKQEGAF